VENIESIRQSYKPERIRVLFIGESAPGSGDFFYKGDDLCGHTKEAFSVIYPEVQSMSKMQFLDFFKQCGCFLDDLCHIPVNYETKAERHQEHERGVPQLSERIKEYKPDYIITIMLGIRKHIKKAMLLSRQHVIKDYAIPYGGNGHQNRYKENLAEILQELKQKGVL
jgi:hypothetical protein